MFNFTKAETRALLITVIVLMISGMYQLISPGKRLQPKISYSASDSIFKRLSQKIPANQPDSLIGKKPSELKSKQFYQTKKYPPRITKKKELLPASIQINTASEKELQKLPRIGPAMSKRIIEYRNSHGNFKTVDELLKVKGIGKKTLEKLKPYITIN